MRILKRTAIVVAVLLVVLVAGGGIFLGRVVTKERVVAELEKAFPCKAEVGAVSASVFALPATVTVSQLKLSPLNPEQSKAGLSIEQVSLKIHLLDLLFRRVHVNQLLISGVFIRDEISKESNSDFSEMLGQSPPLAAAPVPDAPTVATAPQPPVAPPNDTATPTDEATPPEPSEDTPPAIAIDELLVEKLGLHINDRKNQKRIDLEDIRFRLFGVDIDRSNLAAHNKCSVELAGNAHIQDRIDREWVETIKAPFSATGTVAPFDPATGEPAPDGSLVLTIPKGAQLDGVRTVGDLAAKGDSGLGKVKDFLGIDLAKVPVGGVLEQDLKANLRLRKSHLQWEEDTHMSFPNYRFTMTKGSWLDNEIENSRQEIVCRPSADMSKQLLDGISQRLGKDLASGVQKVFDGGDGQLAVRIILTGPPSKPSAAIPPETLSKLFELMSGGLLQSILGGGKK
ncbi:MAG: hypothetical protein JNJ83_03640 [Verrucomicrobiaceae bacterium]|nr:hypothetical protein [Verrucomicrobiaceae bacterium]